MNRNKLVVAIAWLQLAAGVIYCLTWRPLWTN